MSSGRVRSGEQPKLPMSELLERTREFVRYTLEQASPYDFQTKGGANEVGIKLLFLNSFNFVCHAANIKPSIYSEAILSGADNPRTDLIITYPDEMGGNSTHIIEFKHFRPEHINVPEIHARCEGTMQELMYTDRILSNAFVYLDQFKSKNRKSIRTIPLVLPLYANASKNRVAPPNSSTVIMPSHPNGGGGSNNATGPPRTDHPLFSSFSTAKSTSTISSSPSSSSSSTFSNTSSTDSSNTPLPFPDTATDSASSTLTCPTESLAPPPPTTTTTTSTTTIPLPPPPPPPPSTSLPAPLSSSSLSSSSSSPALSSSTSSSTSSPSSATSSSTVSSSTSYNRGGGWQTTIEEQEQRAKIQVNQYATILRTSGYQITYKARGFQEKRVILPPTIYTYTFISIGPLCSMYSYGIQVKQGEPVNDVKTTTRRSNSTSTANTTTITHSSDLTNIANILSPTTTSGVTSNTSLPVVETRIKRKHSDSGSDPLDDPIAKRIRKEMSDTPS